MQSNDQYRFKISQKKLESIQNESKLLKKFTEKEEYEYEMLDNIMQRTKLNFASHRENTNELEICATAANKRYEITQDVEKHANEALHTLKR